MPILLLARPGLAELATVERSLLDRIDAAAVLADMRQLAHSADGIQQGVGDGSVVSGSDEERALAAHIAGRFAALGLDVHTETYPVRAYRYETPRLSVNGERIPAISLHAAGSVSGRRDGVAFASGNEADGSRLVVPLVDAGDGFAPDYERVGDVRGKAVLVRRDLRDWPPAQITEAAVRGAAAVVFYDHPMSADRENALRQDSLWGHEQLPAVAVSLASGRSLAERVASGPTTIALEGSMRVADGLSQNVLGVIEGTEFPDQWVVVSGHYDRWFQGGMDNVSGTAAVLELARVFTEAGIRPRRSMLFLAVGSEEAGLEDYERDWLAGSHAFLLAHPEMFRHAALVVNIDGIGWKSEQANLSVSPDALAAMASVLGDLGQTDGIELHTGTISAIDAWNYAVLGGAATIHLSALDPAYFAIYHTQEDVVLPERFTNLEGDLRVLALAALRAATAPRWTPMLDALADDVQRGYAGDLARVPGIETDDLDAALDAFRGAAAAVQEQGVPGVEGGDTDMLLMATRRALVPWLYAVNGEYTQVVRTREYTNRVVALDGALAALAAGDRAAALMALAALPEGRRCAQLSADSYALERNFWAGEGGWASRYGHRAPPPLPAFESACRALGSDTIAGESIARDLAEARAEAYYAVSGALALAASKLRVATMQLRQAGIRAAAP